MDEKEPEKEINLTYETLFELLRREKNRVELQPLESSFYLDFIEYLKVKKQLLQEKQSSLGPENSEELTKLMIQVDNINKILKELYERREKKIVNIALMSSRSKPGTTKENLLEIEDSFYHELIALFSKYRKGVLLNLLSQKAPIIEEIEQKSKEKQPSASEPQQDQESKEVLVRFLSFVPKFLGEELETYGPFEADEMITLPLIIAKILIDKGKAEEINEG